MRLWPGRRRIRISRWACGLVLREARPDCSSSVVGQWMNGLVLSIGVCLDQTSSDIMNRVISFTLKWAERTLTLKGQAEVIYYLISSLYFVTVWPSSLHLCSVEWSASWLFCGRDVFICSGSQSIYSHSFLTWEVRYIVDDDALTCCGYNTRFVDGEQM